MRIEITPVAKPRMTRSDRWKSRKCTERYWAYKDELRSAWGDRVVPDTFHVIFTVAMPISWSQKKRSAMKGKPHQSKPDCDNFLKGFADCLLDDDSRLWDIRATKLWGDSGSIEVRELDVFKPDWVSPPGDTIADLLEERDWTQSQLADLLGYPESQVHQLINAEIAIDNEIARKLAEVLGSTEKFWLKSEELYKSRLTRLTANI